MHSVTEKELTDREYVFALSNPYTSMNDTVWFIKGQANNAEELGTLAAVPGMTYTVDVYSDEACKTKASDSGIMVTKDDSGKVSVSSNATANSGIYYVGLAIKYSDESYVTAEVCDSVVSVDEDFISAEVASTAVKSCHFRSRSDFC